MIDPYDPNAELMRVLAFLPEEGFESISELKSKIILTDKSFSEVVRWLVEKDYVVESVSGLMITQGGQAFFNSEVERTA